MRDLYKTRYLGSQDPAIIDKLTSEAAKYGGTLECGFAQGREDLLTGAIAPQFAQNGTCYAFCLAWLRHKFEKSPNELFYNWLLSTNITERNLRMSKWMQKQDYAIRYSGMSPMYQKFMAGPQDQLYADFMQQHPSGSYAGFVNFLGTSAGKKVGYYDPRAEMGNYTNPYRRNRYDTTTSYAEYQFPQAQPYIGSSAIWEISPASPAEVYVQQLASSKITKHASTSNHLSKKDRMLRLTLKPSYNESMDPNGFTKRLELSAFITSSALVYQKDVKNSDTFCMIGTAKHQMAAYFEKSPVFGAGSIYFFDPNFGIFKFTHSTQETRFKNFKLFLATIFCLYNDNIIDLQLNLFGRS